MLVVEIDDLHAQPLQAGLAGLLDIGGAAVHRITAAFALHLAEFGGEEHLAPASLDGAAEQRLIVAPAIGV